MARKQGKEQALLDQSTLPVVPVREPQFDPLPPGAFIGGERYYTTLLLDQYPGHNIYLAEDVEPLLPCPNPACGHSGNPAEAELCGACGTSLQGVLPVHQKYTLHEFQDVAPITVAARLIELELRHKALITYRYFAETPYSEETRHYLLLPDPLPISADQISTPQKTARSLNWGAQLADGLAFLHQHGIRWETITPASLGLRDREALWMDLTAARYLSEDNREANEQQLANVRGLARIVFWLATGMEEPDGDVPALPPAATTLFQRVLVQSAPEIISASALAQAFRETVDQIRRPEAVSFRLGRATDVGRVRDLNEDSLLVLQLDRVHRSIGKPICLLAIADGMGGHSAGDIASGLVVDTIAERVVSQMLIPYLNNNPELGSVRAQQWLDGAIVAANEAVLDRRDETTANMGTTLVAALVIGTDVYLANVGDSRAYLINADGIRQITTDHSLVERLIAIGQISPAEARTHPQRNVIYRTLGDEAPLEVDQFSESLFSGDQLLLCSDGLTGKLEDSEIWEIVTTSASPQDASERLVDAANEQGGEDNTSVVILMVR
jgi:PPM family protein phosphatase